MVSRTQTRSEFRLGQFAWAFAVPAVIVLAIGLGMRASLFEWPRAGFVVVGVLTGLLFGLQAPRVRNWQMSIDGERRVAGKLRRLPRGWKVYNDVDLGGARIDHVVVGPSSVWVIEAHHATGSFAVDDDGFYRNGIRNTWTIPKLGKARASLAENVGARPIPVLALCRGYDGLARLGVARVAGISDLVPMMVDEDASGAGSGVTDQGREWLSAQEVPAWRRMLGLGMA